MAISCQLVLIFKFSFAFLDWFGVGGGTNILKEICLTGVLESIQQLHAETDMSKNMPREVPCRVSVI